VAVIRAALGSWPTKLPRNSVQIVEDHTEAPMHDPDLTRDALAELPPDIAGSPLFNGDLAPVPRSRRTWTTYNFAALWISMAHCIPTYLLAGGLVPQGMNWWQALLAVDRIAIAPSHRKHQDQKLLVAHLVDQPIASATELDLVALSLWATTRGSISRSASFFLNWSRTVASSLCHSRRASGCKASSRLIQRDLDRVLSIG